MPATFARLLPGHEVFTARRMRWDALSNGKLLAAAAEADFQAVITVDKNLVHQQSPRRLPIPVIAIDAVKNSIHGLSRYGPDVRALLARRLECRVYIIPRRP